MYMNTAAFFLGLLTHFCLIDTVEVEERGVIRLPEAAHLGRWAAMSVSLSVTLNYEPKLPGDPSSLHPREVIAKHPIGHSLLPLLQ